jgi:hypothetical protein
MSRSVVPIMLVLALTSSACAELWGFGDLTVGDASASTDAVSAGDATLDQHSGSSSGSGSGGEAGSGGSSGSSGGVDASGDVYVEADGGCDVACSLTNASSVTCSGASCAYVCTTGHADCNMASGNIGGCACPAASASTQGTVGGCCVGGTNSSAPCQTQHNNGVGGYYYDCVNTSTYNQTQATEALNSDTAQAGSIIVGTCGTAPNAQSAVFKTAGNGSTGTCTTWVYAGSGTYNGVNLAQTVGTTYVSSGATGDMGCFCSMLTTPNWN